MPSLLSRIGQAARAFVQTSSTPSGIPPPSQLFQWWNSLGIPPHFKPERAMQAYGENPYVYSAINVIAQEIARTKFRLREPQADGEYQEVLRHQALVTLNKPQETDAGKSIMTGMQLKYVLAQHLMTTGEGFWYLANRSGLSGSPRAIYPLNPAYVYEKIDPNTGDIASYVYRLPGTIAGQGIVFQPKDIVHFKLPDLQNWYRGHSPMKPARYAVDTYGEADLLNFKRLRNNAIPAGLLKTDKNIPEAERNKLLAAWNKMFSGSENANKTAFLPNAVEFQQVQLSNADMQFIEGKNHARDEILANFRVGLEMIGHTESQTRANADASYYSFSRFTLLPHLDMITDTLTNDYLPAFAGAEGLEFTFDDPVPANTEEKRHTIETLFAVGALTPNEAREMCEIDPLELPGMDVPYMDLGKIEVGTDPAPLDPNLPADPNNLPVPSKEPKKPDPKAENTPAA